MNEILKLNGGLSTHIVQVRWKKGNIMRGKRWMVLLVAAILAVFAGTGQAAVIYANSFDPSSTATNSWNLTGVQDLNYATLSNGNSATLGFAQNFVDVAGGDAKIYVEAWDLFNISGLTVQAQKADDDTWITLSAITGVDAKVIGWWFDWTKGYEIPGAGSNPYDHIKLSYLGDHSIDVDAVRVDTGNGNGNSGPTLVSEAGALLLFGSGLIGLVGYRRLRRMQ